MIAPPFLTCSWVSAAHPLVVERTVFHVVSDALRGCWIIPSPQRVTESLIDSARTGNVRDLGNTVPAAEIWQDFRDLWHVLILR
jgi:hypothetical protein